MTLTEKYIEDGRTEGVLFGAIRSYQELLGQKQSSNQELSQYAEVELQALHDKLKAEVHSRLRR